MMSSFIVACLSLTNVLGQYFGRDLAAALNDPEDRRLFVLERTATERGLQSVAPPPARLFFLKRL